MHSHKLETRLVILM